MLLMLTWLPTARDVRSNEIIAEAGLTSCLLDQVTAVLQRYPWERKITKAITSYFNCFSQTVMRLNREQVGLLLLRFFSRDKDPSHLFLNFRGDINNISHWA